MASTLGAPLSLTIIGSSFYDDTAITIARKALDMLRNVYGITVYLDVENIDASIGAPMPGMALGWYPETTYIIVGGSVIEVNPDVDEDELVDRVVDAVLGSLSKPGLAYKHDSIYIRNDRTPGMSDAVLAA